MIRSTTEAYSLLHRLGAPHSLLKHVKLVGEAGEALLLELEAMGVRVDQRLVRLGIALHDAGKIVYPHELADRGREHEQAGEELLLRYDVQPEIARCCLSHARFNSMQVTLEELLVALADKLWKGHRLAELERRVADGVAQRLDQERWDVFCRLDPVFAAIAAEGPERLMRSHSA
ncbi:MAG: hypothetical protein DHS20C11_05410 [Lysobacteraceae bacterium]|nr:MAG: hypothetical protein DHS20C11_05410 [Xanthomonadaceae bacterium]